VGFILAISVRRFARSRPLICFSRAWQTENDVIEHDAGWKNGDYTQQPALVTMSEIGALMLTTPQHYNHETKRQEVQEGIEKRAKDPNFFDANNHIRQAQAMMAHDVSQQFGGSMEKAAAAVKARVLVIVSATDHVVTPGPARDFAKLLHAELWELEDDCGHWATVCEDTAIAARTAAFLEQ